MTLSEKICQDINSKFYFNDFVLNNLYYNHNGVKEEICDGLIEFEDSYVVIQVKERQKSESTNEEKWLKRKVYDTAVKQIKDTIRIITEEKDLIVEDLYGQVVNIDKNKKILPVIIFQNEKIREYKKVYHSKSKNININVFSEEDYACMLNILEIPVDILDYLELRACLLEGHNFDTIIDDSDSTRLIFASIETEEDLANYFLEKRLNGKSYNKEVIKDFLGIIQKYHSRRVAPNNEYKKILSKMLRLDRINAEYFMERLGLCWEDAKNGIYQHKYRIVLKLQDEKFGFLFVSSLRGAKSDNNIFYENLVNMFIQRYQLDTAIMLVSYFEGEGNYFINWFYKSAPFKEDTEIQEFLKEYNPWTNDISFGTL